jgi:hypothetical protein
VINNSLEALMNQLKELGLQHNEILDIFQAVKLDWGAGHNGSEIEISEPNNSSNFLVRATVVAGNRKGKLKNWQAGPAFTSDVFDEVLKLAKEMHAPTEQSHVVSRIMFSQRELLGSWRYRDYFQILPCLHDIRIRSGLDWFNQKTEEDHNGPPYPFLIEVIVPKISNAWLQNTFGMKLLDRYEHLLCMFVIGMSNTPLWPNERQWMTLKSNDDAGIEYHLLHSGIGTQTGGQTNTFSEPSMKMVPTIDAHVYDDSLEPYQSKELVLPTDLTLLFDMYFQLDVGLRRKLDRSVYFSTVGQKLRNNTDLAIMNFATAIECLVDSDSTEKCPTCGTGSQGPTSLFKQFMEKYAPVCDALVERRSKLYTLRSLIVHGSRSMKTDVNPFSLVRDEDTPMLMNWLIRMATKNWLRDKSTMHP